MSETLQTIKERRSIRNFKDEQVKEQDLQAVLEAGLYAPSAMNEQSWHFTVIQNTELLKKFDLCIKFSNKMYHNNESIQGSPYKQKQEMHLKIHRG